MPYSLGSMALAYDDTPAAAEGPWIPVDTFGARLALVRQHLGLNVLEAAKRCELNDDSWRNWEAGKGVRNMDKVARKIADALNVDYTWLMAGGPIRSRCFAPLSLVPAPAGQMELAFDDRRPELVGV